MLNRHLLADLVQQAGPLSSSLLRKEKKQAAANHLGRFVTVEAFGGSVPGQDHSVECLADYGVVRRGDQRDEELLGLKTTALLNIKKLARATKITVDGHCLRALLKGSASETFVSNETTTSFDSLPQSRNRRSRIGSWQVYAELVVRLRPRIGQSGSPSPRSGPRLRERRNGDRPTYQRPQLSGKALSMASMRSASERCRYLVVVAMEPGERLARRLAGLHRRASPGRFDQDDGVHGPYSPSLVVRR